MKTKDEYIESLAAELKRWSAQIDVLTAKTENSTEDVKLRCQDEVAALHVKQHEVTEKLKELEEASAEAWEAVKETADEVWDDLKTGLAFAVSKFK